MGENPAIACGGSRGGGAGVLDWRDDEEASRIYGPDQFLRHFCPEFPRKNEDDGRLAAKEELEHVLFKRTLKAADDALVRVAHLLRPLVALHHVVGGYPPRRQERHLVWVVKKSRIADYLKAETTRTDETPIGGLSSSVRRARRRLAYLLRLHINFSSFILFTHGF